MACYGNGFRITVPFRGNIPVIDSFASQKISDAGGVCVLFVVVNQTVELSVIWARWPLCDITAMQDSCSQSFHFPLSVQGHQAEWGLHVSFIVSPAMFIL